MQLNTKQQIKEELEILKLIAIIALLITCVICIYKLYFNVQRVLDQADKALEKSTGLLIEAERAAKNSREISDRVNKHLTVHKLRDYDNSITTSAISAQQTANAYSEVARATIEFIDHSLKPTLTQTQQSIAQLSDRSILLADELARTATTTNKTIESLNTTITTVNQTLVESQEALISTVASIARSSQQLEIITSDPALLKTLKSVAASSQNLESISKDLSDLSRRIVEPIVRPKPTKGFAKILKPLYRLLQISVGAGRLLLIVESLR